MDSNLPNGCIQPRQIPCAYQDGLLIFESMKSLSFKEPWVNTYVERLLGLSAATKKAIIRVIERSMAETKPPRGDEELGSLDAFGMWEGDGTADELIAKIRAARNFSRDRDML